MLQTAILVGVVGRVTVLNSGPKFDCKRSIAFLCSHTAALQMDVKLFLRRSFPHIAGGFSKPVVK